MSKSNRNADAISVKSHASKVSMAPSMTPTQREEAAEKAYAEAEQKKHEERVAVIR